MLDKQCFRQWPTHQQLMAATTDYAKYCQGQIEGVEGAQGKYNSMNNIVLTDRKSNKAKYIL